MFSILSSFWQDEEHAAFARAKRAHLPLLHLRDMWQNLQTKGQAEETHARPSEEARPS